MLAVIICPDGGDLVFFLAADALFTLVNVYKSSALSGKKLFQLLEA